jgi:hypothetical protein
MGMMGINGFDGEKIIRRDLTRGKLQRVKLYNYRMYPYLSDVQLFFSTRHDKDTQSLKLVSRLRTYL